jgi:signal peptidase I
MKKAGKIIGYLIMSILILFVLLNVALFAQAKSNPGEIPSIFGYKFLTVLSGSMRPVIEPGDMIIVKEKKSTEMKKGNIVTFEHGGKIVTHRITSVSQESGVSYQTKGDANPSEDPEMISSNEVKGLYVARIPSFGIIMDKVTGIWGMIVLIGIPGLTLVIMEVFGKKKRKGRPYPIES